MIVDTFRMPSMSGSEAADASQIGTHRDPDAELLARCVEFESHQRQWLSLFVGGPNEIKDDDQRNAALILIEEMTVPLLDQIRRLRAGTMGGIVAKLRALALFDPDAARADGDEYPAQRVLAGVLQDLAVMENWPTAPWLFEYHERSAAP